MSTPREQMVITAFDGLTDTLADDHDVVDLLDRLAGHSVELLAADAAAIMLVDGGQELQVVASTDEQSDWMELLQRQAGEGPCVDCHRTGAPVSVPDLFAAADRWPRFVAALAERGRNGSMHALPLLLRGEPIGTLNLFRHEPGPLPAADLALGRAMADVATIAILSQRAVRRGEVVDDQLQAVLTSRAVIGRATGLLAARGHLSMDSAAGRMRRYARRHHLTLVEVAREVVETDLAAADVLAVRADKSLYAGEAG